MGGKPHDSVGPTLPVAILTYFSFGVLILFGRMRDFFGRIFKSAEYGTKKGFAPLVAGYEDFFTRRLYRRICDCWNRGISSCPGSHIDVMLRSSNDQNRTITYTGETRRCLNLGSYNYLGFGDPNSPTKPEVMKSLAQYGVATSSTRLALGTTKVHQELEALVARFVGKPAAMVFGMGFGTNSTGIPALVGKGGLIISDSNNHSSIVAGARASGATVRVFKHNDAEDLEAVVRRAIIDGQPRTHRPWSKILIMVEGIYSMEGELCPLPDIVKVKKKYGCYLYVDEAHSIGALGKTGRGIVEHTNVNPADVDILMGTFTKSFGAVGGYLAGEAEFIDWIVHNTAGSVYSASISPPAAQQCISALKIIMGEDGTDLGQRKINNLHENANLFRRRLINMGADVLGDWDSPVIPMMIYQPAKLPRFSRLTLERNLAVVVVGFPAAPLLECRVRFCISAAHTRQELLDALETLEEIMDEVQLCFGKRVLG